MRERSKVLKILNRSIALAIFLVTCIFIWQRVFGDGGAGRMAESIRDISHRRNVASGLYLIFFLMVVNWVLETVKWRYLVTKVESVSFFRSFAAVMTGITVSSFLPNRSGEFLGRIYILRTTSRIEGILITLVGSMSQLLVTILAGTAALLVLVPQLFPGSPFASGYLYACIAVPAIVTDLLLLLLWFRLPLLNTLKERLLRNRLRRFRKFFHIFALYGNRDLGRVLLLSVARYAVFSAQFYLLLQLFGVTVSYPWAMALIALVYFIMAIIPTVALTELGVRGSVAIYLFGLWSAKAGLPAGSADAGVFAASTLLWMVNIAIPALAGAVFAFKLRFFRS